MKTALNAFVLALAAALAFAAPVAAAKPAQTQSVVLAGGCFWGMQAVFGALRGVTAVAGYSGGDEATAHYEMVSTGTTGHAESVELTYDPAKISFAQILEVYFLVAHDPTELDRQGPDDGTQYRSEIFYTTPQQLAASRAYIAKLTSEKIFNAPIVTQLAPLRGFYPAEAYHQNFVAHNPDNPYVVYNDLPKLQKLKEKFPQLLR
ncbi:MAG TPA: peptide-methionine (S)-S-oxide reductase MsrA [Verrucomicrobiae bacterium]|nr:peptide-methionine (S)-S-oxide reductase MsrA [Verrucomicrobiae bacterium]